MDTLLTLAVVATASGLLLYGRLRPRGGVRQCGARAGGCATCSGCSAIPPTQRSSRASKGLAAASLALVLSATSVARGADTLETWGQGELDVDLYMGFDGAGRAVGEKTVFGDLMLGYGISDHFSAYFGTKLEGDEYLTGGQACIYLGLLGTLVDTRHFDLDAGFEFAAEGESFETLRVRPMVELNLDRTPNLESYGLYLRTALAVNGHRERNIGSPQSDTAERQWHVETVLGSYLTVAAGHQLLLEYSMDAHPAQEGDQLEVGGFAFGYNVELGSNLELISEAFVDLPEHGEPLSGGLMIGFTSTFGASS